MKKNREFIVGRKYKVIESFRQGFIFNEGMIVTFTGAGYSHYDGGTIYYFKEKDVHPKEFFIPEEDDLETYLCKFEELH